MPDALPNSAVLDQGGACGAAGPAPAPGSASGRPPGASRATAIETLIKTTHPSRRQVARTAAVSASDYLASAVMGDVTGGSPEAVTARRRQTCGPGAASPSRRIAGQGSSLATRARAQSDHEAVPTGKGDTHDLIVHSPRPRPGAVASRRLHASNDHQSLPPPESRGPQQDGAARGERS